MATRTGLKTLKDVVTSQQRYPHVPDYALFRLLGTGVTEKVDFIEKSTDRNNYYPDETIIVEFPSDRWIDMNSTWLSFKLDFIGTLDYPSSQRQGTYSTVTSEYLQRTTSFVGGAELGSLFNFSIPNGDRVNPESFRIMIITDDANSSADVTSAFRVMNYSPNSGVSTAGVVYGNLQLQYINNTVFNGMSNIQPSKLRVTLETEIKDTDNICCIQRGLASLFRSITLHQGGTTIEKIDYVNKLDRWLSELRYDGDFLEGNGRLQGLYKNKIDGSSIVVSRNLNDTAFSVNFNIPLVSSNIFRMYYTPTKYMKPIRMELKLDSFSNSAFTNNTTPGYFEKWVIRDFRVRFKVVEVQAWYEKMVLDMITDGIMYIATETYTHRRVQLRGTQDINIDEYTSDMKAILWGVTRSDDEENVTRDSGIARSIIDVPSSCAIQSVQYQFGSQSWPQDGPITHIKSINFELIDGYWQGTAVEKDHRSYAMVLDGLSKFRADRLRNIFAQKGTFLDERRFYGIEYAGRGRFAPIEDNSVLTEPQAAVFYQSFETDPGYLSGLNTEQINGGMTLRLKLTLTKPIPPTISANVDIFTISNSAWQFIVDGNGSVSMVFYK